MCGGSSSRARCSVVRHSSSRLGGAAVDQIEVERREPDVPDRLDGSDDVVGVVPATEQLEDARHHRLHAEADPRHPAGGIRGQQLVGDVVRVALDGDLGTVDDRDLSEGSDEQVGGNERRRPAADEHGVDADGTQW